MKTETQTFGELSEFKNYDVELYRSSDLEMTKTYFRGDNSDDKDNQYFEVLFFGLEKANQHNRIYVRFPGCNFFIQMYGEEKSRRGDMRTAGFENVLGESYLKYYEFYSCGDTAMLLSKSMNEFNFMTKVASYDKGNPFNAPYPNETFFNYDEIKKALSLQYLKIPDTIRRIEYCYKTMDENPTYILVDYPAYNFNYDNHRFFVIQNSIFDEFKIEKFVRYRDGGTTIITALEKNGVEHIFFSSSPFSPESIQHKWDETKLIEATKEEKNDLITLLKLDIDPKNYKS